MLFQYFFYFDFVRKNIEISDVIKKISEKRVNKFNLKSAEDDDFEKSIMLNLCEGKNFLRYVEDAFNWSDKHINMISEREVREQLLSEYESEKVVWRDFQRNLGYVHNLDEMTISTYMQEFSMASKEGEPRKENVQFLTIHAAKGKEFDNVIIMGMVNDELPSFQSLKNQSNGLPQTFYPIDIVLAT